MKRAHIENLLLIAFAAVLITSVSICAPQRLFTDYVDINIIFSVGKSFWKGKIVYRDLFEHKGPLMYAITSVAALVSKTSFTGVWILEIVAASIFLITAKELIRTIRPNATGLLLPGIAYLIYHSKAFVGGTAEEFCLPMLGIALLIGVRAVMNSRMPRFKESIVLGVTAGIVFWIKYNMVGFYIGFLLLFIGFAWKDRNWKGLWIAVKGATIGLLIVTLPILLFFGINSALDDLFRVYFYDNVSNYANRLDFLYQGYYSLTGTLETISANPLCWVIIVLGILETIVITRKIRLVLLIIFTGFFTAWFVYCGGMNFNYYGFILLLFMIFFASFEPPLGRYSASYLPFMAAVVCAGLFSARTIRRVDPETIKAMPQYVLTEEIKDSNASLLTYDYFDAGFYTAGNLYPQVYHFTITNCIVSETSQTQLQYVIDGVTDYIVSMKDLSFTSRYEAIKQCGKWRLYKKTS